MAYRDTRQLPNLYFSLTHLSLSEATIYFVFIYINLFNGTISYDKLYILVEVLMMFFRYELWIMSDDALLRTELCDLSFQGAVLFQIFLECHYYANQIASSLAITFDEKGYQAYFEAKHGVHFPT